jgi:hypothetical protein
LERSRAWEISFVNASMATAGVTSDRFEWLWPSAFTLW